MYPDLILEKLDGLDSEMLNQISVFITTYPEISDPYYLEISSKAIMIAKIILKASLTRALELEYNKADIGKDFVSKLNNFNPITKKDRQTFVYLLLNNDNMLTKIGYSYNPGKRHRTISSYEKSLIIVRVFEFKSRESARMFEKELHNIYAKKRIRGEWFNLHSDDIKNIDKLYGQENTEDKPL
jgi:hypothetical protein